MSDRQKARMAHSREEAARRKLEKQRQKQAVLPEISGDDENPFGLGSSLG